MGNLKSNASIETGCTTDLKIDKLDYNNIVIQAILLSISGGELNGKTK